MGMGLWVFLGLFLLLPALVVVADALWLHGDLFVVLGALIFAGVGLLIGPGFMSEA